MISQTQWRKNLLENQGSDAGRYLFSTAPFEVKQGKVDQDRLLNTIEPIFRTLGGITLGDKVNARGFFTTFDNTAPISATNGVEGITVREIETLQGRTFTFNINKLMTGQGYAVVLADPGDTPSIGGGVYATVDGQLAATTVGATNVLVDSLVFIANTEGQITTKTIDGFTVAYVQVKP